MLGGAAALSSVSLWVGWRLCLFCVAISYVGECAKIVRGKGGWNKSPCCVLWAGETWALSHEKTRQGPTLRHANMSLEGIQKQNHAVKPC